MADQPTSIPSGKPSPGPGSEALPPGTLKRGRGRPPGSKGSGLGGPKLAAPAPGAAPKVGPVVDTSFVQETAVSVLEIVDEGLAAIVTNRARRIMPPEHLATFLAMVEENKWDDGELILVKKSVGQIAAKYDWLNKYGPELLLVILLGQHGLKQARLMALVSRQEAQFARMLQARRGAAASAPEKKPEAEKGESPHEPETKAEAGAGS